MKVLFGSVIYQEAIEFLDSFIGSLSGQTEGGFMLLLINDGVNPKHFLDRIINSGIPNEIITYEKKLSPVELRIKLLEEACQRGADVLILGDADDTFSENRVEEFVKVFSQNEDVGFAYNDLLLFNGDKALPDTPNKVNGPDDILEFNFLGLSNTAIKMQGISLDFIKSLNECKSFVFDWYLYTRLLLKGFRGIKVSDAYTFYRVYDNNYAGLPSMTEEAILKETEVKRRHYEALKKYGCKYERLAECYHENNIIRNSDQKKYYWWNLTRVKGGTNNVV